MITILHTNDLHGCVELLPRLAALIRRERARNPHTLLLDAGDTALGGRTGKLGAQLLSLFGYTAMTPGNSENDVPEHREHLGRVGAPVVVANVAPSALGFDTVPYLVRAVGTTRVAVLGLTTPPPYPPGHPLHRPKAREVPVADASEAAHHWVPQLRDQADLVVVLSHLGLRRDVQLAHEVRGIDLILGGHSHHRLASLLRIGDTHIAQAGVNGTYLGVITAEPTPHGFRFVGRLEPVWQPLDPDPTAEQAASAWARREWPEAENRVGATDDCWANPWAENPWSSFVADGLREAAGADVCFYNAAALIPALDPGPLTEWGLRRCFPGIRMNEEMGMANVVTVQLTGEFVRAVCEHSVANLPCDQDASVPPSFCLPGNNLLQVSGLRAIFDLERERGERVVDLRVGDELVDPRRAYRVATSGFLARGYSGFRWFAEADERQTVGPERDLLLASLRAAATRLPGTDGRLRFGKDSG